MTINIEQLQTAVWIYDLDDHIILKANQAALKLWDSTSYEELFKRDFKIGQSKAVREMLMQFRSEFIANNVLHKTWEFTPKGRVQQAQCQFSGTYLDDGRLAMMVEAIPVSPEANMQQKSSSIISLYNQHGKLVSSNPPFIQNFGQDILHLKDLFDETETIQQLLKAVSSKITFEKETVLNSINGKKWYQVTATIVSHADEKDHILVNYYDIHERKIKEQNLQLQAFEDPLTGLINRRGLVDKLQTFFANKIPFTMLYIDLDGFKMINDSLGHLQGDDILIKVTERLKAQQKGNIICRFGGDEFILIINNDLNDNDLSKKCQLLIESLSRPYQNKHGIDLSLSASIGIANYPRHGSNFEQLVASSDAAMYQAKKLGKKQCVYYLPEMENLQKRMSNVAQKLSFAIEHNELALHYQPIVDTSKSLNNIISFEALLRWNNRELGFISPEEVIQIAEKTGLIYEIENWVLQQALSDLVKLKTHFHENMSIAVNFSALHLLNKDIVPSILSILDQHKLQPHDLTIELTESVFLSGLNQKNNPIQSLINNNIKVNIDDFGTGFSSLAYLHDIPASIVKVDKTFLKHVDVSTTTLECIHKLINELSMGTLIEGIETKEHAVILQKLGYNLQQGYFHGRPQAIDYYIK